MSQVTLKNVNKNFGKVVAVRNLDLEIKQGEFFSLLGPSGCGKTTTLRMIAGFEFPTSGAIFFGRKDVTYLKPNRRNAGMVFQNFALFPHMTVFENVAFGLQARKIKKVEIKQRVRQALELVDLQELELRKVTQISGGQQQRVALARAIVIEPDILLLDEPLSNLDAKLRMETREQIRALQKRLGITTIYVTHDQEEALTLSDRIAVMNRGICLQVGPPEEIYHKPADEFVANFVGNSNVLRGEVIGIKKDSAEVAITSQWHVQVAVNLNGHLAQGQSIALSIRPESIELVDSPRKNQSTANGIIKDIKFSGSTIEYEIDVNRRTLRAKSLASKNDFARSIGSRVFLQIEPSDIYVLSSERAGRFVVQG